MTDAEYELKLQGELLKRDKADLAREQKALAEKQKAFEKWNVELLEREARVKVSVEAYNRSSEALAVREEELRKRESETAVRDAELNVRENIVKEKERSDV